MLLLVQQAPPCGFQPRPDAEDDADAHPLTSPLLGDITGGASRTRAYRSASDPKPKLDGDGGTSAIRKLARLF